MKFFQKIHFFWIFFLSIIFLTSHAANINWSVNWHPNGNYFAIGGDYSSSSLHPLYVYSFDKATNSFTITDSRQMASATDQVWSVAWSPDGNYLAAGTYKSGSIPQLRIYSFDGSRISGSPIATQSYGVSGNIVDAIAWHPSGNYIAIGGGYPGGSARNLEIYSFDGTTLSLEDSKSLMSMIRDTNWDSTGSYIIAGGDNAGTYEVYTYSFAGGTLSASYISRKDFGSGAIIYFTSLSPDNKFALLGGSNVTGGNELQVYSFDNGTLSASALDSKNYGQYLIAARFHPNQQYVAIGGENPDAGHEEFEIYGFDSQEEVFTTNPIISLSQAGAVCSVDWSIDGCFILLGGKSDVLRTYRSYYKGLGLYAYDGTVYNIYKDTNKVIRDGENAKGWVGFRDGITVLAGAGAKIDTELPLSNGMDLRTSCSLILENNLILDSDITLSGHGTIYANGKTIFLKGDVQVSENSVIDFISNVVVDGQGHDITLGKYAQLLVDGGVTVTFKNMTIKNTLNTISCPPIRCMDWYSQACFDNVTFAFNDDFAFRNGQFFIYNDVEFTGTSKFSYRSVRPSFITQHSNMIFNPQTIFEYYPSTTDNALIKMQDKTSSIIFDGSTLQTTHTGLRLTKGSIYFDNKVTLSSVNNTYTYSLDPVFRTTETDKTWSVAWSPDGRYLAVGNYEEVNRLYRKDGESLTLVDSTSEMDATCSVAWSPDGRYLAVGNDGEINRLYRLDSEALTLVDYSTSETDDTRSVAWSSDGRYLAVGNIGGVNRLYRLDGESLRLVDSTSEADSTWSVAWSPDGRYLAVGNLLSGVNRLYRLDGESLTLVDSTSETDDTYSVAWSPNGRYLAVGNSSFGVGNRLYRLDGESLTLVDSTSETDQTTSVAWSSDGHYLAAGTFNSGVNRLYRLDGEFLALVDSTNEAGDIRSIAWSPDGCYLAVGNYIRVNRLYKPLYYYDTSPQSYSNSIVFGDSAAGVSQDLPVYLLSAARVGIYGKVWNDLVDSGWNFQSRDSYVSLDRYDSLFKITNAESVSDWKKNQIIKSSEPNTLFLQDNQIWTTNMDQFAPEETFELVNNLEIPDGQITQFSANVVIDGQGHDLILGKYAQLLVDGGVTVTFKNMTIKNTLNTISCPPIRCMDWYSQACFDNVTFAFNDDFAFRNGQFFIYNDVEFTGTSKFSYRSVRPSYITQHSNMIFDPQTTFEYYPSTTDNVLIKMQDKTASIIFDGSTLQTTHTGIRLTKGSIYFDNKVTLSSANNTVFVALGSETSLSFGDYAYSVNWSPDGKYLAVGGDNSSTDLIVYEWNGSILTQKDTKDFGSYAYSVNWSPDGKYLAVGGGNSSTDLIVYEWNGSTLTQRDTKDFGSYAYSVNWSPDGKYLAVGGDNSSTDLIVYEWDGSTLTQKDTKDFGNYARSVNWSPDGKYLAVGGQNDPTDLIVYEWNGTTLTQKDTRDFGSYAYSVSWSPDGKYLAVGGVNSSTDLIVYEWDGTTLTQKDTKNFGNYARSVNWSPDGKYLAVGGDFSSTDLIVYEWNGTTLTQKDTKNFGYTYSVHWSFDGRYLSAGGYSVVSAQLIVYGVNYKYDTSSQAYSNGIIFGNSALGTEYDLDMYVLGDAYVEIYGKVWNDCVN